MNQPRRPRIAIAGAGLGGLFAATALAQSGCAVVVCERAGALAEVGAGVQVSPNGARLLERLGVLADVRAAGFAPEAAQIRAGVSGARILRVPLGAAAEARWGAPYLQIHRADLLAILAEAAQRAGATVRLGAAVAGVEQGALLLSDGGAVEADVVLGADGLRSAVREALLGREAPRFTGHVAWRATVPTTEVPPDLAAPDATVWAGPGRHVVTYRLRGGALVNVVAVEERAAWAEESWSAEGDPAALRAAFAGWRVAPLLAAVQRCWLWGLFDRDPLPLWTCGAVGLLGDACHPMPPFMAQGAVQAFEDGATLARLLPGATDLPAALRAYEAERRGRAARVLATARGNAALFHARGPGAALRHGPVALVSRLAPALAAGRLDWLYGHDAGDWRPEGSGSAPQRARLSHGAAIAPDP